MASVHSTATSDIKTQAHQIIDSLPDSANWEDILYRMYVRQCIEAGLEDVAQGRVISVDEVRKRFGLQP